MGFWKKLASNAVLLQTSLSSQECWDVSVAASLLAVLNRTPSHEVIWHRKLLGGQLSPRRFLIRDHGRVLGSWL